MTKLTREELLVILMEECAEVIQAASKCLRFGYDRQQEGYGINDEVLAAELGDLFGIADALPLKNWIVETKRAAKIPKAEKAKELYGA